MHSIIYPKLTDLPEPKLMKSLQYHGLSRCQIEVCKGLLKGKTNKEIANEVFTTEKGVKFHVTNIFKLFKIKKRTQIFVLKLGEDGIFIED